MKRIFTVFGVLALSVTLLAQKGKVTAAETMLSSNDLDGAKKAIDEAMASEKSNTWPKTYIVGAKVYTKLYQSKKDNQGLIKSIGFYDKAIELDKIGDAKGKGKNKYEKDINLALTLFKPDLITAGIDCFNAENFSCAVESFEGVMKVSQMSSLSSTPVIDTAIIYNCALAAYNGKDWERAAKYFEQSIQYGYENGNDAVLLLHQVYTTTNDTAKIASNLENGLAKFPSDDRILTTLINYYLQARQNQKALDYLNKAIEHDPKNPSFYYARGVLNDQSKEFGKAETDYLTCLELDGNYFNALYNLGVLYYNQGVEKNNAANDITNMKEYDAAKKVANSYFDKALPYMEKAFAVLESKEDASAQDKIAVLESLKNLYYRFDNLDKYNQAKDKIDALQQ
jgi:tetratricopeptide (TPR) repeat protein